MPKQFLDPQGLSQFTENLEQSIVADKYSSSTAYVVGDYCIYENLLYRCTTAIPSGESWNSSHWVQILIMGELTNLNREATTTTSGLMSATDKVKLNGIESGAEVNVQSDWNAVSGDALILNKPTLGEASSKGVSTTVTSGDPNLVTSGAVYDSLNSKMDKANPTGTGALSIGRKSGTTIGSNSGAIGYNVESSGDYSFAEGRETKATFNQTHAEGYQTEANGNSSHSENYRTKASGSFSHAQGYYTAATRRSQHVFGEFNVLDTQGANDTAKGAYIEIVGKGTSDANRSNARTLDWDGNETLAGDLTINGSISVGSTLNTKMDKANPTGTGSLSIGRTGTTGSQSVAVGYNAEASGARAVALGHATTATGDNGSFAEGYQSKASGTYGAHSEGRNTEAKGTSSHAEGYGSIAEGSTSHAEGINTKAEGAYSHAEGLGTLSNHRSQHTFGEYNLADTSSKATNVRGTYIEIVGKGSSDANRSNARTLDWSGNETLAGDLKINGTQSLSTLWTTLSGFTVLSGKSGSIASFSTDIADKLFSCYVNVTAQQAGSGTPSPSNPRAISGWSGANITRFGKNVYPVKVGRDLFADNRGATHTTNDDILTITMASENNSGVYGGTGTATNNTICQTIKKFSGSFVFSLYAKASANNSDVYFGFGSFGNTIATLSTSWQRVELPLTLDSAIHTLNFYNRSGSAITVDIKDVQIEQALSTATPYEAYNGITVTIPFGDTYYGGVLDVTNGKLTVTHGILDMGSVSWTRVQVDTYYVFYYVASDKAENYNFICSCYNAVEKVRSNLSDLEMGTYNTTNGMNRFTVRDDSYTNSNTFQTAMTGQKIVFELATPVVINLTPTQITTLLGSNNIYADCGDIDLRYLETIGNKL